MNDAGAGARITVVDGQRDSNGREPECLLDGRAATEEDQPLANFFFRPNTDGGRIALDLGKQIHIRQVNTYSWHANTRTPQVYALYGSAGQTNGFNAAPKRETDPLACGWTRIANVDTRPSTGTVGGQYGVSISDTNGDGTLGEYRFLLLDIRRTEDRDAFGNTFYTELDVIDANGPAPIAIAAAGDTKTVTVTNRFRAGNEDYEFVLDTTVAPDLHEWACKELTPVVLEWYPKIVAMLPSDGYEAPKRVTLAFRDNMGGTPAAAGGTRIGLNSGWYRRNLQGEAKGAAVHELVHVVQQYGRRRRTNPNSTPNPGWLTEGIADYIRWFKFEPETHGAEITRRNVERAKYNASYRVTGNFLNWATQKYDTNLVKKLNAALREGRYSDEVWQQSTRHTAEELGAEWKEAVTAAIAEKK